ncbi:ropporin-1-like [Contarinia nasturtii]|uniref:ropporin-1-like n=1 Tax=Contarinia nasturtii TaxID=265458 RepID=UPI0012D3E9ED|nr:ropporin-1-like [Contarinia nasturtii]
MFQKKMSKSKGDIDVPEAFPYILKTYAKDALRTQPYDLLSWSAAYFRCIADNIKPPAKLRFEENTEQMIEARTLTPEYLKVLINQIGKGFFVERHVLERRWKELGLAENDLLVFLNISGMLRWERIHWLELLAVMTASMCTNIEMSICLMCELLTDDTDGGSNSIPIWMFNICYSFLAHLNSSLNEEQIAGIEIKPAQINAQKFRNDLINDWKICVNFSDKKDDSISLIFNRIKVSTNFDEIIKILSERNVGDDIESNDSQWKCEIIRKIGAPWNWIYQFVNHYRPNSQSYNFYECQHTLENRFRENLTPPIWKSSCMPGIGSTVALDVRDAFLSYVNSKAIENNGMINPTNFKDEQCPPMC